MSIFRPVDYNSVMTGHDREVPKRSRFSWHLVLLLAPILYLLSSGPVIGIVFRLREATGWDQLYCLLVVYYPLFALGHGNPIDAYIEWWVVEVFHTVGPG